VRRSLAPALVFFLLGMPALFARGDDPAQPVLHEYVSDSPTPGADGLLPPTIAVGTDRVPAPDTADLSPAPGESVLAPDASAPEAAFDESTQIESAVEFQSVFNPDVVPFKRGVVLDAVGEGYVLGLRDPVHRKLELGTPSGPDRDLFYGSVLVDLTPGADIRLPTPAADVDVVSYQVEPPASLDFSMDGADNLYVSSADGTGRHRLVYLMSAPSSYFGAAVPTDADRAEVPPDLLSSLPSDVKDKADDVAALVGVTPEMSYADTLSRLVAYFRAFKPGDPPPGDDPYVALSTAQRGVCRHRALAFVITALDVGIPARYVANEGHVFVEAWVPRVGWMRIDLGGAAEKLDVENADGKVIYQPRVADPFPRPLGFGQDQSQLSSNIEGLSSEQRQSMMSSLTGPLPSPSPSEPGKPPPSLPPAPGKGTQALDLEVARADGSGFRGESLDVAGFVRAASNGTPVGGLRVDVYLEPVSGTTADPIALGHTVSKADGRFDLTVDLPSAAPLGQARIAASTPGDDTWAPTRSP
jgi:transglutaminase-like putative cysteine protease